MTPLAHHLGAAVSVPVRSLAHALDLYRRRTMPDPLHPAGYRAAANTPTPPPSETPPSLIDSQMENLQAANRQLRDDLARAEATNRDLADRLSLAETACRIDRQKLEDEGRKLARMQAAIEDAMADLGTSSLAYHVLRDALAARP